MKSWGFSRMRKQRIPGHFSLLPRGLGTRLIPPSTSSFLFHPTFSSFILLFSIPPSSSFSYLLLPFLLSLSSPPLPFSSLFPLLSSSLSSPLPPPPLFPLHIVSMPVAKAETSKATAFGSSLGSSLAPTKPTGIGSAHSSLATMPRGSPAQHHTPSPHHPHQRSVRGNILGFLRKKDKVRVRGGRKVFAFCISSTALQKYMYMMNSFLKVEAGGKTGRNGRRGTGTRGQGWGDKDRGRGG